ncbi:MAG TPA: hypothetical protein VIW92_02300 [Thermoanaerobaculia bacterium]
MPNTKFLNHQPERHPENPYEHPSPASEHGHGHGDNVDQHHPHEHKPSLHLPRAHRPMSAKYHHV